MSPVHPAEQLLLDLGITEPDEIDVEVIAWLAGAIVRYRAMSCGDARILGVGGQAVITVDAAASMVRRRFSVAHELGHWHHHRGQRMVCNDAGHIDSANAGNAEREADRYAASLLMPYFMMMPVIGNTSMSIAIIDQVAERFKVSRLAATLRLVDLHTDAFAVVIEEADGRRWFRRSPALDPRWFLWSLGPVGRQRENRRSCPATDWYRGVDLVGRCTTYEIQSLKDGRKLHVVGGPV